MESFHCCSLQQLAPLEETAQKRRWAEEEFRRAVEGWVRVVGEQQGRAMG